MHTIPNDKEGLKHAKKRTLLQGMNYKVLLGVTTFLSFAMIAKAEETPTFLDTDWPNWRGPTHNGIAPERQNPPTQFSTTENVIWKAPVPGLGHGTPIVVRDKVVLLTADQKSQTQFAIAYERSTGKIIWQKEIHKGGFMRHNKKASQANGSLSCDGNRIFFNFPNAGAAWTTALELSSGKILWQTRITDYVVHQGYGSTPLVYKDLLIVAADNKKAGVTTALDRRTGKVKWSRKRPKKPNYPSPVIFRLQGKEQLILTGCDLVTSLDPSTGQLNWEFDGATTECVSTPVTDGIHIFTSGGYPTNHVSAMRADGTGEVVWKNKTRVYVPSMIIKDGHLYAATDGGIGYCWNSATGETLWRGRLGGTISASPTLVGDKLYVGNEAGDFFIFKATPEAFEIITKTRLGDQLMASPVIVGNRIYQRATIRKGGERQEMLFCIGNL